MTIRIGHASIDENRKAKGGTAGDQTGKEVGVRSWYDGGWQFLARARSREIAGKIASACEAGCANPNVGYDQNQRNTLNTQARKVNYDLSKITVACETDCSAFVAVCVQAAGVDLGYTTGNGPTTRTLKSVLSKSGSFDIFTDSVYLTGAEKLRRGDILVKAGSHTVIVLDDGETVVSVELPQLAKGSRGECVKTLQILLIGWGFDCGSSGVDGKFGNDTESALKTYQKSKGLTADGCLDRATWHKIWGIG